jgi:hypothetical protein
MELDGMVIVNGEFGGMWKEAVLLSRLSQHYSGGTEEYHSNFECEYFPNELFVSLHIS